MYFLKRKIVWSLSVVLAVLAQSFVPASGSNSFAQSPAAPQNLRVISNNNNRPPVAVDDAYSVVENRELLVAAPGVLVNDSDPEGDLLIARTVSWPTNGRLAVNEDGSFAYTAAAGFTGTDSFSYKAFDGSLYSNVGLVSIAVTSTAVEPWFEDSFEGTPPDGWKSEWHDGLGWSPFIAHDTTDEGGTPTGGGQYAYRQWFPEASAMLPVTADYTTNTFTSENHGYVNDMPVRLHLQNSEGAIPGGVEMHTATYSHIHYVVNATQNTFQLRRYTSVINLTNDGQAPFYVNEERLMGGLSQSFGEGLPVPQRIGEGDDISISYWLKYHPDFDFGNASGNKQWMLDTDPGDGRIYNITQWGPEVVMGFTVPGTGNLRANVGGGFYMPAGEWVKFDWYIKVSVDTVEGRTGILKGWVNNELRWDYSNIATIYAGSLRSFVYWAQVSSGPPLGENQERYLDQFRIGPGAMVLSEQED